MEIFLEMNDCALQNVADMLNKWMDDGWVPDEAMQARVVLLFKIGDTSKLENYRPISLLKKSW